MRLVYREITYRTQRGFDVDTCRERGTPVPIPNTAVKPFIADDTWKFPGKVGRCLHQALFLYLNLRSWSFFRA